jgi:hypothetical protein
MTGGGGGADLDVITAAAGDILTGKVTVDKEGDPLTGTLSLSGDAAVANVLSTKTFYSTDAKSKLTGTMPNRGAVSQALNAGGSYTVPDGYHNGSGSVTANSLSSQTAADATAASILSGKTAWVNGSKLTGTMAVSSVVSFSVAQYSSLTAIASWAKPSIGPWSGLYIRCKKDSYPSSTSDGTLFYEGSGTSATGSVSSAGTWYFRAWNYITTSAGRMYGGYSQGTVFMDKPKGIQTFTSSGIFTVPNGVTSIDVFCVGGGGGGNGGDRDDVAYSPNGACGGQTITAKNISVTPGSVLNIIIGAGGLGGIRSEDPSSQYYGTNGGETSVVYNSNKICSAQGGWSNSLTSLWDGNKWVPVTPYGSGGGTGVFVAKGNTVWSKGGDGGSNGSDGNLNEGYRAGQGMQQKGQGTTTKAFGEASGTLYAGGGGGSGSFDDVDEYPGVGGAGGGGKGAYHGRSTDSYNAENGQTNTGGGGGGGATGIGFASSTCRNGGAGGSGVCLVRWGY